MMMKFSAFHKQIDRLTLPADNYGAMRLLADPSLSEDAGDWVIDVESAGNRMTIHSQRVHTGPGGLNIPELSGDATDGEIYAAINNLEIAQETLGRRRSNRAEDFDQIIDCMRRWK